MAALAAASFLVLASLGLYRRLVTRQVADRALDLELVQVAESAIAELADPATLAERFAGGPTATWAQAFRGGTDQGGLVVPAGGSVALLPNLTLSALGPEAGVELDLVEVIPLFYLPAARRGRLRFVARVRARRGPIEAQRTVAHDYDVNLFEAGGQLRFQLGGAPVERRVR